MRRLCDIALNCITGVNRNLRAAAAFPMRPDEWVSLADNHGDSK